MKSAVDEAAAFAKQSIGRFRTERADYLRVGVPIRPLVQEDVAQVQTGVVALALFEGSIDPAWAARTARDGDVVFDEAFRLLVANHLEGKLSIIEPLLEHVIDIERNPPQKRKTHRFEVQAIRDLCIASLVMEICKRFGLHATGRSAKRKSACMIVAEAWGIGEDTVRKIWIRNRQYAVGKAGFPMNR